MNKLTMHKDLRMGTKSHKRKWPIMLRPHSSKLFIKEDLTYETNSILHNNRYSKNIIVKDLVIPLFQKL